MLLNSRKRKKKSIQYYGQVTHKRLKHMLLFILFSLLIIAFLGIYIYFSYIRFTPKFELAKFDTYPTITRLYSDDDSLIWKSKYLKCQKEKVKNIPDNLKYSLISSEDHNFYKESGVNYFRTTKVCIYDLIHIILNLTSSKKDAYPIQGASTITQQLVKLSYFSTKASDRTIKRKIEEMILSEQLNQAMSKNKILTLYLNKVYFGNAIFGIKEAAKCYFDKPTNKLSLTQSALLVGMLQAPSQFDPYLHPEAAKTRRDTVLFNMNINRYISKKEYLESKNRPLQDDLVSKKLFFKRNLTEYKNNYVAGSYIQAVLSQMKNSKDIKNINRITDVNTNLNLDLQKKLYEIVNSSSIPYPNNNLQVAAVILDSKTGNVVAEVGARQKNLLNSYNRAISPYRSCGSTIKPILDYGAAFEFLNWSTEQIVNDSPYKYLGTNIEVHNWDNKYLNDITARNALALSRNVPAVKTLMAVGLQNGQKMLKNNGINLKKIDGSNAIGVTISATQLASAYTALANNGIHSNANYIRSLKYNHQKIKVHGKQNRGMSDSVAYMLTDILKKVPTKQGIGSKAEIEGLHQAGKTGTVGYDEKDHRPNDEVSDEWYVGYTKQFVIAVWTGYDDPKTAMKQNDAQISQLIYQKIMAYAMSQKNVDKSDWSIPDSVVKNEQGGLSRKKEIEKGYSIKSFPSNSYDFIHQKSPAARKVPLKTKTFVKK